MIKSFEELGEELADLHNRISYLENLVGNSPRQKEEPRETVVRHIHYKSEKKVTPKGVVKSPF